MNIREFKEGDFITRNASCVYHRKLNDDMLDGSYLGEKLQFLGIDEESKIIFYRHMDGWLADDEEPSQLSFARDEWDEGWCLYPKTLREKITEKFFKKKEETNA